MRAMLRELKSAAGFISGVAIGLAIATPVFGATVPDVETWNTLLTLAAVVLLIVGLLLNASAQSTRTRRARVVHIDDVRGRRERR